MKNTNYLGTKAQKVSSGCNKNDEMLKPAQYFLRGLDFFDICFPIYSMVFLSVYTICFT